MEAITINVKALSMAKAILVDNPSDINKDYLWDTSKSVVEFLKTMAIFFHANECLEILEQYGYESGGWFGYKVETAVMGDNVEYLKAHKDDLSRGFFKRHLASYLSMAIEEGSRNVEMFFRNDMQVVEVSEDLCYPLIKDNYRVALQDFKAKYYEALDTWELSSYTYNNVLQWLPRELIEDQLEMLLIQIIWHHF